MVAISAGNKGGFNLVGFLLLCILLSLCIILALVFNGKTVQRKVTFLSGQVDYYVKNWTGAVRNFNDLINDECLHLPFVSCSDQSDLPLDHFFWCGLSAIRAEAQFKAQNKVVNDTYRRIRVVCLNYGTDAAIKRHEEDKWGTMFDEARKDPEVLKDMDYICWNCDVPIQFNNTLGAIRFPPPTPTATTTPSPTPTRTPLPTPLPSPITITVPSTACQAPPHKPEEAFKMIDEEKSSPSKPSLPYTFKDERKLIDYDFNGNETVCLSSSPDGAGQLQVDDLLEIEVLNIASNTLKAVKLPFFDSAKGRITPSLAQDITKFFAAGKHEIHIVVRDQFTPVYSTSAIYIVIWK